VTLVVKVGGSVRDLDPLLHDVAASPHAVVLVHGASRELNDLSTALGHEPRMVESVHGDVSRYTDSETMDHFLMAYAGKANKRIVERLRGFGVNAVGLTGLDGGVVQGRRRADLRIREQGRVMVLHDNHVGTIERVDTTLLNMLLQHGYTPVLTPPIAAKDGTAVNADGDRLAAAVAVALHASHLIILSDTPGLLRDAGDESTMIRKIDVSQLNGLEKSISGRARTKLRAAVDARQRGVGEVVIADGRVTAPLRAALDGAGTRLV
jgi:[amino group carrier protein]-L-2-aminoadipate/L-glutamate 6-kinase